MAVYQLYKNIVHTNHRQKLPKHIKPLDDYLIPKRYLKHVGIRRPCNPFITFVKKVNSMGQQESQKLLGVNWKLQREKYTILASVWKKMTDEQKTVNLSSTTTIN